MGDGLSASGVVERLANRPNNHGGRGRAASFSQGQQDWSLVLERGVVRVTGTLQPSGKDLPPTVREPKSASVKWLRSRLIKKGLVGNGAPRGAWSFSQTGWEAARSGRLPEGKPR